MCQAFEGEKRSMIARDQDEIARMWAAHKSGEHRLSADELKELVVRKIMLDDA